MAHYGITYLTAEHQWNKDELLSCIDGKTFTKKKELYSIKTCTISGITIHDLESFIPQMLSRFYMDSLMYGNITKEVKTKVALVFLPIYSI